ncbi:hypothetical protein HMPREF9445_03262 [Bacteroides clarus YIT 12056]|uniref:Uncharacterized protein n=1 Tax=Bacteroides clarus YIT 12056 TaxID=762984 RepID=A0ABN0CJ97_9BACE|nr:hypothetical protein HMPREF9445_03262 [Bacteroides clarus YIT 12056]
MRELNHIAYPFYIVAQSSRVLRKLTIPTFHQKASQSPYL